MSRFTIRRTVLSVLVAAAACVSLPAFASKEKPVIGFSIDDLRVERWARDRDFFIEAAKKLGATVNVQSADGDTAKADALRESMAGVNDQIRETVEWLRQFWLAAGGPAAEGARVAPEPA